MNKRSDFEWDSNKDALIKKNMVFLLPWRSVHSWTMIVSFWRTLSTAMRKNDFTALAGSLEGL